MIESYDICRSVPSIRKDDRKKLNSPWLSSVNLFQCLWPSKAHASQAEKNYIRSKRGGPRAVHNLCSDVKLLLACEQALHLGVVVKRRRAGGTREETRKSRAGGELKGSRAARFTRPNRTACSRAKLLYVVAVVFADSVIYVKDLWTFWGEF